MFSCVKESAAIGIQYKAPGMIQESVATAAIAWVIPLDLVYLSIYFVDDHSFSIKGSKPLSQ